MKRLVCGSVVALGVALGGIAAADDAKTKFDPPVLPPADHGPHAAAVPGPPAPRGGDSAWAGSLKGLRVVSMSEGTARVVVGDRTLDVRPGDAIGGDVVRSITSGQIVLDRPATSATGEASVVVSFDAQGRSRVRVYASKDPTAPRPPQGR